MCQFSDSDYRSKRRGCVSLVTMITGASVVCVCQFSDSDYRSKRRGCVSLVTLITGASVVGVSV